MPYYAHVSDRGPIRYGRYNCALGVLSSRDDKRSVGMALCKGWNADHLAVWDLHVIDAEFDNRASSSTPSSSPGRASCRPEPGSPGSYLAAKPGPIRAR